MERFQVFSYDDNELMHDRDLSGKTMEEVLGKLHDHGTLDVDYIMVDMLTATKCQVQREVGEITDVIEGDRSAIMD